MCKIAYFQDNFCSELYKSHWLKNLWTLHLTFMVAKTRFTAQQKQQKDFHCFQWALFWTAVLPLQSMKLTQIRLAAF